MNLLICTVGLPRSGKSTWINELKSEPLIMVPLMYAPRVSPDSIRLSLHGQRFAPEAEDMVWTIAKLMVKSLFNAGHNIVIVDATNTTKKRRDFWKSKEWEIRFKILDTPASECIERARHENDEGIEPIISRMADQFEPLTDDEKLLNEDPLKK